MNETINPIVQKLLDELKYTNLEENIKKLFEFITSDKVKDINPYHRVLLENQLHAMNLYHNMLMLRIGDLSHPENIEFESVGQNDSTSN